MLHFLFLSSFPTYLEVTQTCHLDLKIYTTIRRRQEIIFEVFSTQVFLRFFEIRSGGGTKEIKNKIRARASLLGKKVMGNEYIILPGLSVHNVYVTVKV